MFTNLGKYMGYVHGFSCSCWPFPLQLQVVACCHPLVFIRRCCIILYYSLLLLFSLLGKVVAVIEIYSSSNFEQSEWRTKEEKQQTKKISDNRRERWRERTKTYIHTHTNTYYRSAVAWICATPQRIYRWNDYAFA